ncbi:hypothetical protein HDU79_008784 [Rhizoclosmatium sp. JEL0117]|nr:hypothetical protein HDU79_008784 [Rhizoclosmatium sp. JEL0117]
MLTSVSPTTSVTISSDYSQTICDAETQKLEGMESLLMCQRNLIATLDSSTPISSEVLSHFGYGSIPMYSNVISPYGALQYDGPQSRRTMDPTNPTPVNAPQSKRRHYRCTIDSCEQEFTSAGHLHRHERIHTQERPFKCSLPRCDMTFSRSDTALKHSRNHIRKLQMAGHQIPDNLLNPQITYANGALKVKKGRKESTPPISAHDRQESRSPVPILQSQQDLLSTSSKTITDGPFSPLLETTHTPFPLGFDMDIIASKLIESDSDMLDLWNQLASGEATNGDFNSTAFPQMTTLDPVSLFTDTFGYTISNEWALRGVPEFPVLDASPQHSVGNQLPM